VSERGTSGLLSPRKSTNNWPPDMLTATGTICVGFSGNRLHVRLGLDKPLQGCRHVMAQLVVDGGRFDAVLRAGLIAFLTALPSN
jgi:hypothetical protein